MPTAAQQVVTLVLQDGSKPAGTVPQLWPFQQPIALTQAQDFQLHFDFFKQDRTPAPIPDAGTFRLVVLRHPYDDPEEQSIVDVQGTVTDNAGGADCGYFTIAGSDLRLQVAAQYWYGIVYVDDNGRRWQCGPMSVCEIDFTIVGSA